MAKRRSGERRKTFNKRQRIALAYPCRTADEMMHPRFVKVLGDVRTILTVDIDVEPLEMFDGRPVWHASVGILGKNGQPTMISFWTGHEAKRAEVAMQMMLKNVGDVEKQVQELGDHSVHVRRVVSDDEIRLARGFGRPSGAAYSDKERPRPAGGQYCGFPVRARRRRSCRSRLAVTCSGPSQEEHRRRPAGHCC